MSNEPNTLKKHKKSKVPTPNYDNFREKADVLKALWKEQNGLCAFCMQQIQEAKSDKMLIEHFYPEDKYLDLLLEYRNYLGVCLGGKKGLKDLYHCDKSKKNIEISICPHDKTMMEQIKFASDGSVFTGNDQYDYEINEVLRLNLEHLRKERKAIITATQKILSKEKKITKAFLQKEINRWEKSKDGKLQSFCQVAVSYLNKKIQQVN